MKDLVKVGICSSQLSVSFYEVEGCEYQTNFCVELKGYLNDSCEDDDEVGIAFVEGTIASLPYNIGKGCNAIFELEVGNYSYAYNALSPLYRANGELNYRLWSKIGGEYADRVIYVDKVVVRRGFVSENLGATLVIAGIKLIYQVINEKIPVVAILGSHDGFPRRGKAVQRYFKKNGFKPLKPKEELSHYLPISVIKKHPGIENVKVFFSEQNENRTFTKEKYLSKLDKFRAENKSTQQQEV
jgi:hypothetical protein